jgi:hypothetical protein
MDISLSSVALPAISTVLSGAVLCYVKWTREDIKEAVKTITEVKDTVAVNSGRISHLEQDLTYKHEANRILIGGVGGKLSGVEDDVARLDATLGAVKTQIAMCPTCPQPGQGRKP